jgi:hypothetical protein
MYEREKIWNSLKSRFPNQKLITVDELLGSFRGDGIDVSRTDVVDLFTDFHRRGVGHFIVGRRGRPSRIILGRNASEIEDLQAVPEVQSVQMVTLNFPLRAGLSVKLTLPDNLTRDEAARIKDLVETYVAAVDDKDKNPVK